MSPPSPRPPIPESYVVPGWRLVAGEYPAYAPWTGGGDTDAKLARFLDAGVDAFVDLTDPDDGLAPYEARLGELAAERGVHVSHDRLTIRDMDVCDASHMHRVLDTIEARLAEGRTVYVHCWGGVGRTGTLVACWLVRHGVSGDEALQRLLELRARSAKAERRSPETDAQHAFVRGWQRGG